MSIRYIRELQALRQEIETGGAQPSVIDSHVGNLLASGSATLAEDLLVSLSDEAIFDEGMFSIIHAVESLDETPFGSYVSAVLSVFPTLSAVAPRWASIVLMRLMNSDSSRHELVRQLREAPKSIREPIRSMCEMINKVSPEFLNRTVPVTIAANR